MNRCSFCEWIPIVPGRVWPLAGHARLGQNTVVGSMAILLSWLCWGACQEEVCLDPHFPLQPHSTTVKCGATYQLADATSPHRRLASHELYGHRQLPPGFAHYASARP